MANEIPQYKPDGMSLLELKAAIDRAVESAGRLDPQVEVWTGNKMRRITSIGQFGLMPDVTITLGPVAMDLSR